MFVTNWISTTKIQKISEITNFFRHYFLSRTEVMLNLPYTNVLFWASSTMDTYKQTICNNQCCQGIVWLCFCHKSVNLEIQAN